MATRAQITRLGQRIEALANVQAASVHGKVPIIIVDGCHRGGGRRTPLSGASGRPGRHSQDLPARRRPSSPLKDQPWQPNLRLRLSPNASKRWRLLRGPAAHHHRGRRRNRGAGVASLRRRQSRWLHLHSDRRAAWPRGAGVMASRSQITRLAARIEGLVGANASQDATTSVIYIPTRHGQGPGPGEAPTTMAGQSPCARSYPACLDRHRRRRRSRRMG